MRECMGADDPKIASELPAPCQTILHDPTRDIQWAALTLKKLEMSFDGYPDTVSALQRIAGVYTAAASRLVQLTQQSDKPSRH